MKWTKWEIRRAGRVLAGVAVVSATLYSCEPKRESLHATDKAVHMAEVSSISEEIHSIHAPFGIPDGTPVTNDLIFRYSYTVSTNDQTRFADWIAYTVTPESIEDTSQPRRSYRTDLFLDDDETLEERSGSGDYDGAYAEHGYDRGHLVPLRSFHGSPYADELNYLSVLAPQTSQLNRGVWRSIEGAVRKLVESEVTAYVLAGTAYDQAKPMPLLPGADEPHRVPTAYWMIVYTNNSDALQTVTFLVPQRLPDSPTAAQFLTAIDSLEEIVGLDFFTLLDDEIEAEVEAAVGVEWFSSW